MATAPSTLPRSAIAWVTRNQGLLLPMVLVASIMVLVIPLPPAIMDVLLATNITLSVVVLLTTIYVGRPLEFSVFPSLLLGSTLFRLVLNVATTRLILTRAAQHGVLAAGGVIRAFGEFVAGDMIAVGLIIFVIIVVIQFVVITKGATRISEVAARFTLDGMPGKQMAIDADLNAGLIDEHEARRRREEISREADFYGAMDGASKFVRGDAIAGVIITLINILGGLYVGMVEAGMGFRDAIEVFTKLTIGDGLVSQVPAFIVSLSAGLIVTRSTAESNLGEDVIKQLSSRPEALMISAGFLGLLAFTSLPALPLLVLGASCAGLAYAVGRTRRQEKAAQVAEVRRKTAEADRKPTSPASLLSVDPLELEVGYGLIRLVDKSKGGDLLERITAIRQQMAEEMGILLPPVRIRDNVQLSGTLYQLKIRGMPVAHGEAHADRLLAMDAGLASQKVQGIETVEPAFGLPAVWIPQNQRERAEMFGYTVVDPSSVLATHLTEIVKRHADELLTREQVKQLIDQLKEQSPALVEEVVPDLLKTGEIQKVLQNLLRERVSIRNLETILEVLGDYAPRTKDPAILTEYVRNALARWIWQPYLSQEGTLHVVTLDPALEDMISGTIQQNERGSLMTMAPATADAIVSAIQREVEKLTGVGHPAVVLTSPQIRAHVRRLCAGTLPTLAVLSYNEVARDVQVESIGMVVLAQ